jgi:DNA-binding PadR family transcriptional regulator
MMPSRQDLELLTRRPAVFHILLALTAGERHGLGIADEVDRESKGTLEVGPGTLYRSLKEMARDGLITDTPAPADEADPRRRFYAITPAGRSAVESEARRLARVVEVARENRVLPELPG